MRTQQRHGVHGVDTVCRVCRAGGGRHRVCAVDAEELVVGEDEHGAAVHGEEDDPRERAARVVVGEAVRVREVVVLDGVVVPHEAGAAHQEERRRRRRGGERKREGRRKREGTVRGGAEVRRSAEGG